MAKNNIKGNMNKKGCVVLSFIDEIDWAIAKAVYSKLRLALTLKRVY